MAQKHVARTGTERALDMVSTPNSHNFVKENYSVWCPSIETTMLIYNLGWTITEYILVP